MSTVNLTDLSVKLFIWVQVVLGIILVWESLMIKPMSLMIVVCTKEERKEKALSGHHGLIAFLLVKIPILMTNTFYFSTNEKELSISHIYLKATSLNRIIKRKKWTSNMTLEKKWLNLNALQRSKTNRLIDLKSGFVEIFIPTGHTQQPST